jgi:hypothetical protein
VIEEVYRDNYIGNIKSGVIMTKQEIKEYIKGGNMTEMEIAQADRIGSLENALGIMREERDALKDKVVSMKVCKQHNADLIMKQSMQMENLNERVNSLDSDLSIALDLNASLMEQIKQLEEN